MTPYSPVRLLFPLPTSLSLRPLSATLQLRPVEAVAFVAIAIMVLVAPRTRFGVILALVAGMEAFFATFIMVFMIVEPLAPMMFNTALGIRAMSPTFLLDGKLASAVSFAIEAESTIKAFLITSFMVVFVVAVERVSTT